MNTLLTKGISICGASSCEGHALPGTSDILAGLLSSLPWILGIAAIALVIGLVVRSRGKKDDDGGDGGDGAHTGGSQGDASRAGKHTRS